MRATTVVAAAVAALLGVGCGKSNNGTVLVVVVTASGSPAGVTALDVTLDGSAGLADNQYGHDGAAPIVFPTTLAARLPARITGDLTIEVRATDAAGATVATGQQAFTLRAGERQTVYVRLDCDGLPCGAAVGATDAGGGGDGGAPDAGSICGNGRIDPGETCDIDIPAGSPGACPPASCDDGVPCTTDRTIDDGCARRCTHAEITTPAAGDRCCPAHATAADDPDCPASCGNGVVDPGETCDTGIAAGTPGACPSATACDDADPCTTDALISDGTCAAICLHQPVVMQSGPMPDGCCPVGAWNALDSDCPVSCGNGVLEAGELCDPGLPAGGGGCPASCDDADPCTSDATIGAGCQTACSHVPVTSFISGDGCCPAGGSRAMDTDCPASCGNGVLEAGEGCDKQATGSAACPTQCPTSPSACVRIGLVGTASDCSAHCQSAVIGTCDPKADGCCPAGCTAASDPDCSTKCGNGTVETANGETCDTAIPPGAAGACPTACSDGNVCTRDVLVGAGTCSAACVFVPIAEPRAGDGCCPPGLTFAADPDCPATCGNGVVEAPLESCDYQVTKSCPATCPAGGACTVVTLSGTGPSCSARCSTQAITTCASGDGCCPAGCAADKDGDCPAVCGDGVVEVGERCDRGITAGLDGWCPPSCDDGDACTSDFASGTVLGCSRACSHAPITACRGGDGCCPPGCVAATDSDCGGMCGDSQVGAGETCDPPAACPTTCPDDGDACTLERLTGDAGRCTAACRHVPITACSGQTADLCCPTGCTRETDVDC